MASRVYDELYAQYGRTPTEEEVLLRLERKLGRDRATASAEDATSRTVAAAESPSPPGEAPKESTWHRWLPLVSAVIVTMLGVGIVLKRLMSYVS